MTGELPLQIAKRYRLQSADSKQVQSMPFRFGPPDSVAVVPKKRLQQLSVAEAVQHRRLGRRCVVAVHRRLRLAKRIQGPFTRLHTRSRVKLEL